MPKLPDYADFNTNDRELNKMANFGLEMMKWVPKFQELYYGGKMIAQNGEAGVNIKHGWDVTKGMDTQDTTVTQEYFDAYNQYTTAGLSSDQLKQIFGDEKYSGPADNYDSIHAYEQANAAQGNSSDGFTDWRNDYIAGVRHAQPDFGPGANGGSTVEGGEGILDDYKNLNHLVSASEWNHIDTPNQTTADPSDADDDQAYFINDDLTKLGLSWQNVQDTLKIFGSENFYDIVMTGGYAGLTSTQKICLTLAMKESRERIWAMESEVYGPLADTRNDSQMMAYVDNFVQAHNPYSNNHELGLFLNLFRIQHSVTNYMTGYWEGNETNWENGFGDADGHDFSLLDRYRFRQFSTDMGSEDFQSWLGAKKSYVYDPSTYRIDIADGGCLGVGLYAARYDFSNKKFSTEAAYESAAKTNPNDANCQKWNAVSNLIENWFGAYYPEYGKPVSDDVPDFALNSDGKLAAVNWPDQSGATTTPGRWVYVPGIDGITGGYDYVWEEPVSAYLSLGYDRKYNEKWLRVAKDSKGTDVTGIDSWTDTQRWKEIVNKISSSYFDDSTDTSHPHYAATQFMGLNDSAMISGPAYNNNWIVHLVGLLWKEGQGKTINNIVWYGMQQRQNDRDFNSATDEYEELKDELTDEQKAIEKAAANKKAQMNKELQEAAKQAQQHKTEEITAMNKAMEQKAQERRNIANASQHKRH